MINNFMSIKILTILYSVLFEHNTGIYIFKLN